MSAESWVLGVMSVLALVFGPLAVWEFVLNWRLAHGRCLCGRRHPCKGGCR